MIKSDFQKNRWIVLTSVAMLVIGLSLPIYILLSEREVEVESTEKSLISSYEELSFKNMPEQENDGEAVLPKTSIFTTLSFVCGTIFVTGALALYFYKGKQPVESFSMRDKLCL